MTEEGSLMALRQMVVGGCAIEQQEAQGMISANAQEKLPTDISDRAGWEALGFTFGEPYAEDPIFMPATLPAGWTKQASATDHRTSNIVDDAGNVRGSYFYKAAFYDRNASMCGPARRYHAGQDYDRRKAAGYKSEASMVMDIVTGKTIFESQTIDTSEITDYAKKDAMRQAVMDESIAWLAQNFPDHDDPGAYWPTGLP